jgi:hypothetical protein
VKAGDLETAIAEKTVARSWLMRGTLHLVAADDLRWILSVVAPVLGAGSARRQVELGLDGDIKTRGVRAIRRILSNSGPLTRYQIVDRLQQMDVRLDPKTQAPIHLVQSAAMQGVCCSGPDRNGEPTYVLLDDWLPAHRTQSKAGPAELARRYFAAYGPASAEDFSAWLACRWPYAAQPSARRSPA